MRTHFCFVRRNCFGHGRSGRVGVAASVIFALTACQHITTQVAHPIASSLSPPIVMDGGFCNGNIESIRLYFRTGSVIPADGWKERVRELIDNARCGPLRDTDTIIVGFDNQDGEIDSPVLMRNLNAERARLISEYLLTRGIKRFAADLDGRSGLYEVDQVNNGNSPTGAYAVLQISRCNSQKSGSRYFDPLSHYGMTQKKAKAGHFEAADREIASW